MDIGLQIKKFREQQKISQEELALKIFVSRQTISNWETNKSCPDVKSLITLSNIFNVSLDNFIKEDIKEMREIVEKATIKKFNVISVVFLIELIVVAISAYPLFSIKGNIGIIIWLCLFAITLYTASKIEKFKKSHDIQTYKEILLHTNAVLYILDPKNSDLADLGTVMPNVYHTKEEMIDCVNAFYEGMVRRSEEMKKHPNYKTGENYAYLGLPPCFLIFDEYVAFFEMLGTKESVSLLSQLKKIVMLGRQAGYFLIVACQRPDAKYFSDGIRDNFNFRVGLGRISELGYGMLFGSDVKKQFFQKRIKGRGYCDVGTSVISEFYTPLVPKGHDFLQTIGSLAQARQDGTATCEAKGDGTD